MPYRCLLLGGIIVGFFASYGFSQDNDVTLKIKNKGQTFYGRPLGWNGKQIALLRLDGRLSTIALKSKEDVTVVSDDFKPYSPRQLSVRLQKEFGDRYTVSTTRNFVVVHPWGKSEIWANPFEDFYSRFQYFFENHGVDLAKPEFTLTAVVLRSRKDFDRFMHNDEKIHNIHVAGYYSRKSNRIMTYDPSALLRTEETSWIYQSTTIIHESAHQAAFNVGLHNRFAPPPTWLSEGLATLFEARGINHAEKFQAKADRINSKRLAALTKYHDQEKLSGFLKLLVPDDRLFQSDPEFAYAISWALTFYLVEKNPEAYFEFLREDAARKNFTPYPAEDRIKSFVNAFGADVEELETSIIEYFFEDVSRTR